MSDNTIIAIVAGVPGILAAIGSIINMFLHGKMQTQVDKIEKNTNSLSDHLIEASGQLEYRKGQERSETWIPRENLGEQQMGVTPTLPAVTGVTARYQGSGNASSTTTFYYWVQALYPGGWSQLSTPANTGPYCPAALTGGNFAAVQWNFAPGAIGFLVYRNTTGTTPANGATAIFIATAETGFKDDGSSSTFTQVPRYDGVYVAKALYNFAVDGGVAGAIIPSISDTIPKGAVCFGGFVNSPTAFTGATSVAVGTSAGSAANSILVATVIASLSIDAVIEVLGINSQAATNKPSFKMTVAGQIQLTLVGAATAGVLEVNVLYVLKRIHKLFSLGE